MDNLPKNFDELRVYLSRIKPWAAVAAFCAAVLLGFYSLQGMQYWQAWNETKAMSKEIDRISQKLDKGVPSADQVAEDLAARQGRLDYLKSLFEYSDVARLMGIVSTISWDTGIDLPSISASEPSNKQVDGLEYRTQVLTVTTQGNISDTYRFLATLHDQVKVMSVPTISIANRSSDEATAQVQLVFYLSPKPISDEEESN